MSYVVGADVCEPCRLIRVANPSNGALRLTVKWSEARAALNVWAGEQRFSGAHPELTADIPAPASEVVVYVGVFRPVGAPLPSYYVPFTVSVPMK